MKIDKNVLRYSSRREGYTLLFKNYTSLKHECFLPSWLTLPTGSIV